MLHAAHPGLHPQAPQSEKLRVREAYREFVATRFGPLYANATLSKRGESHGFDKFAPVVIGPEGIALFSWPAVEMKNEWLEPASIAESHEARVEVELASEV